jgi:hypothetical protein
MIKTASFVTALALVALTACGGKPSNSAASAEDTDAFCPSTDAKVKTNCGCRPTEKYYVDSAGQLGDPEAKQAALACATGKNGGDAMTKCMKEKGTSGATLALMGSPKVKDDAFDACAAKNQ